MESVGVATGVVQVSRRVSRVESALVRLFRVSSVEAEIEGNIEGHLREWNDRLKGQRSRIARRLALIDSQLGLSESRPVLSVIGSR